MPVSNVNRLIDERVQAICDYHRLTGTERAELDLSGGVDSAVMAGLLVLALGPRHVTLVHTRIHTSPEQTRRAIDLAHGLAAHLVVHDLGPLFERLLAEMIESLRQAGYDPEAIRKRLAADPTVLGSLRSCLRAPVGRGYNRLTGGGIRHGTGNECEDRFLRYYQKGGDGEVDTNPIEMLSKTEVLQLACGLARRLPAAGDALRAAISATPSADLWGAGAAQTDEGELLGWLGVPLTYGRVDAASGAILRFGSIERVSRFLDWVKGQLPELGGPAELPDISELPDTRVWDAPDASWQRICDLAASHRLFAGMRAEEGVRLLGAARRAERLTRHKANDNIPALGTRGCMLRQGLLDNHLDPAPTASDR